MSALCYCKDKSIITKALDIKRIKDDSLVMLMINGDNWETLYKCKYCMAFWEERYTGGRWDGWPELYKVSAELVAAKWKE